MLILIEHGDVLAPAPIGSPSILIDHDKIIKVGPVDRRTLDALGVEYEVIDAGGCYVIPGLIDPHEHLLGGSGEGSLADQSPMIFLSEIVPCGITTVVGVLGVDTTMKTMAGLLARVKGLTEEGLTARMWVGGYNVPPTTILRTVREDLMYIDEVVGAGEIAIADKRSLQQSIEQLAELVLDTHIGGLLSGKAGLTHLHVGEEERRLAPIRELLDKFDIEPAWLYPTHVTRSEKLFDEAIELARRGCPIDTDTQVEKIAHWVRRYLESGAPRERFTLSSDAGGMSPRLLWNALRGMVLEEKIPLETLLPMVSTNAADILKLTFKGRIETGKDGDIVVVTKEEFEVRDVISRGKRMFRDGSMVTVERFLTRSDRRIDLTGRKESPS